MHAATAVSSMPQAAPLSLYLVDRIFDNTSVDKLNTVIFFEEYWDISKKNVSSVIVEYLAQKRCMRRKIRRVFGRRKVFPPPPSSRNKISSSSLKGSSSCCGAGEEIRTPDVLLGKQALYR